MQDSEIRRLQMGQRVYSLLSARAADFPAGSRGATLITALNAHIAEVEQQAAKQVGASLEHQQSTEQKRAAIKSFGHP